LHNVRFVEHLSNQPHTLHPGVSVDTLSLHNAGGATPPTSMPQLAVNGGDASPPAPMLPLVSRPLRRSTQEQTSVPSREDSNDSLTHGRRTAQALQQVRESASHHEAAKTTITVPSTNPSTLATSTISVFSSTASVGENSEAAAADETAPLEADEAALFETMTTLLVDVEDPDAPKWSEVLALADCDKWLEGARLELDSLRDMEVYQLVPRSTVPSNHSVMHGKFVCHLKRDENGNPIRHKVQWVAKGFQQVWGRDFSKTTSPTA